MTGALLPFWDVRGSSRHPVDLITSWITVWHECNPQAVGAASQASHDRQLHRKQSASVLASYFPSAPCRHFAKPGVADEPVPDAIGSMRLRYVTESPIAGRPAWTAFLLFGGLPSLSMGVLEQVVWRMLFMPCG